MKLFGNRNNKKNENIIEENNQNMIKETSITKEQSNSSKTSLSLNEEENKALAYFNLNPNFTIEDLNRVVNEKNENKYTIMFNSSDDPSTIEEDMIENEKILKLYLYKKVELDKYMKMYFSYYSLNPLAYIFSNNSYETYSITTETFPKTIKYIAFQIEYLEEMLMNAKNEEEIEKYNGNFCEAMNHILKASENNNLLPFDKYIYEELHRETRKEEIKNNLNKLEEIINRIANTTYEEYEENKREVLTDDFRRLLTDERIVEKGSKAYKDGTNALLEMRRAKSYDELEDIYKKAILRISDNPADLRKPKHSFDPSTVGTGSGIVTDDNTIKNEGIKGKN